MAKGLALMAILLALAACESEPLTETPIPTIVGAIAPSPVVDPLLPTADAGNPVQSRDFTPGASTTYTPSPTDAVLPLTFSMSDLTLHGSFYQAPRSPAPALILLHGPHEDRSRWGQLASQVQAAGYNVFAVDLRGYGETGGAVDWRKAPADIAEVVTQVRAVPGVDGSLIMLMGSDTGGTLAIVTCAADARCKGTVELSPRAADRSLSAQDSMLALGKRPALFMTSADDDPSAVETQTLANLAQGDHIVKRYPGKANGIALLEAHPEAAQVIIEWLRTHL